MSDKKNKKTDDRDFCLEQETTSDESIQEVHASLMGEKEQTRDGYPIMPIMIVFLFSALMLIGGIYMADYGGRFNPMVFDETRDVVSLDSVEDEEIDIVLLGRQLYTQSCAMCHQPDGQGTPGVFPPLAETEWVVGSKDRLIRVVLNGLQGPIEVRGNEYSGIMPAAPFANDNLRVAAVLTFIRQEWGNEASEVTEEEVAGVRQEVGSRGMWTAEELEPYAE